MPVLPGQDFRGSHQGGLVLVGDGDQQGVDGDRGLAGADVGLEQPLHGPVARQIPADRTDRPVLIGRQREGKQPANVRVDGLIDRQHRGPAAIAQLAGGAGPGPPAAPEIPHK